MIGVSTESLFTGMWAPVIRVPSPSRLVLKERFDGTVTPRITPSSDGRMLRQWAAHLRSLKNVDHLRLLGVAKCGHGGSRTSGVDAHERLRARGNVAGRGRCTSPC
jgi:hypothetical protein